MHKDTKTSHPVPSPSRPRFTVSVSTHASRGDVTGLGVGLTCGSLLTLPQNVTNSFLFADLKALIGKKEICIEINYGGHLETAKVFAE